MNSNYMIKQENQPKQLIQFFGSQQSNNNHKNTKYNSNKNSPKGSKLDMVLSKR